MKVTELSLPGLFLLESPVHGDDRGYFREWFKLPDLSTSGISFEAQQANLSRSVVNVVRGLHYSLAPNGQAKVVTCVDGSIYDVIVDVRVGSTTFGKFESVVLNAGGGKSVLLPPGVAHGFCVISENASVTYLLSSPFDPTLEFEINPFDPEINVPWPITGEASMSAKDAAAPSLATRLADGQLPTYSH